ncbi:unnamed protein product, partial [Meganyctiphanes norvegica]
MSVGHIHTDYSNPPLNITALKYFSNRVFFDDFPMAQLYIIWRPMIFLLALPVTNDIYCCLPPNLEKISHQLRLNWLAKDSKNQNHAAISSNRLGVDNMHFDAAFYLILVFCLIIQEQKLIQRKNVSEKAVPKACKCGHLDRKIHLEGKKPKNMTFGNILPAKLDPLGPLISFWELLLQNQNLQDLGGGLKFDMIKSPQGVSSVFLLSFGLLAAMEELKKSLKKNSGFNKFHVGYSQKNYSQLVRKCHINCFKILKNGGHQNLKICTDLRLLANMKELEEPFETNQIGSSAMPYKRNPMRSERCCALARHLMAMPANALNTAATQWMERTLDDSANRRISLGESFLAADGILMTLQNICEGMVVYEKVIARHIAQELPFMATENFIMAMVKAGGNRQDFFIEIYILKNWNGCNIRKKPFNNDLDIDNDNIKGEPYYTQ